MSNMFKGSVVKELNPSDYKNGSFPKTKGKKGMVAIVAAWCGHCQRLKPEYIKVANVYGNSFPMYYIDAEKYSDFATKIGVQGFPTIKILDTNGVMYKDYSGERTQTAIMAFICKEASVCKRV